MAKRLGLVVILLMSLLTFEFTRAMESPSPAVSPEPDSTEDDSPLPPSLSPETDSSPSPQQEEDSSPSPQADSIPSPASSPEADSPLPPASSPEPESLADSPSPPPPPPPPQPESPSPSYSPSPEPASAPADDDDDDTEQETEYFPSPTPAPAQDQGEPEDLKASEGDEFEDETGEDNGMSGLKKAGIIIGALLGVGAIVIGALVYKKRRENMTRARYTYFSEGEFL